MKNSIKNSVRRVAAVIAALAMLISVAACSAKKPETAPEPENVSGTVSGTVSETEAEAYTMNVAALSGPTGIGMAQLARDGRQSGRYVSTFAGAPEELVGLITTGEADVACVPTNLAATLYAKTGGDIRVCAVTTLGVLYMLDTSGEVSSIADLAGKTIGATGEGSNPEYILNYILEQNGLVPGRDVEVKYYSEHAELASLMVSGDVQTGMLPVPFATQVQMKSENVGVIDLQSEWAKIADAELAQGVIITTAEFAKDHAAELDTFLADFKASSEFAVSNVDETAAYVEELGILPSADLAKKAIPDCNIVYIDGEDMKATVNGFLTVLYNADPKAVGGAMPDDDFYYIAG